LELDKLSKLEDGTELRNVRVVLRRKVGEETVGTNHIRDIFGRESFLYLPRAIWRANNGNRRLEDEKGNNMLLLSDPDCKITNLEFSATIQIFSQTKTT